MGAGSSKAAGRKKGYGSSCFGLPKVLDEEKNEEVIDKSKHAETESCHDDQEPSSFANCNYSMNDRSQEVALAKSDVSGTSSTEANRSLNTSDRPRSRFGIFSEGIGFRLGRTASLGSTNADGMFSCKFPISHADGFSHAHGDSNDPPDTTSGSARQEIASVNPIPAQDPVDHSIGINNSEGRRPRRRNQEPVEGTARFSRTLSVGRLRDRVLRRTSILDDRFGPTFAEYGSLGAYIRQGSGRRDLNGLANAMFDTNEEVQPASTDQHSILPRTARSHHNNDPDNQFRESRGQETLEHRSAFLERRRIRSQVRALQRLGSRFENLSGHDRSCILSGQHRTGYCTCRTNGRAANSGNDTGTRASISRIVMLAEALFEVLDEIHQQAVVLSSRPSLSSTGSVPAPKEVVDCIPVKIFTKLQKQQNDDSTQCYICLLECEDGDCMRILPCGHEFHRTCVDKWLKEIHRVCPLCRGDVCTSDACTVN